MIEAGRERVAAFLRTRSGRVLLVAALGLVVVGLGANMVRRVTKPQPSSAYEQTHRYSRHLVYERVNVYEGQRQGTHAKYPPFFFLLAAPFVALGLTAGAALWYLMNLMLAVVAAWLSVRTLRPPGSDPPPWTEVAIPFALVAVLVVTNLQRGQVNLTILALMCGGLFLASRGRDLRAGLVLGVAVALKLTPALLVLYFLWKGAWRVALGVGAALIVCWGLLPFLVFGAEDAVDYARSWAEVVAGFADQGAIGEGLGGFRATNQSLTAAAHRYFTEVPALPSRGFYVNVASLDPRSGTVDAVVKGLGLLLLAGLAWRTRGRLRDRRGPTMGVEAGLVMIAMLVISPISWINHFVALMFPYAVAVEAIRRRTTAEPQRLGHTQSVVASWALVTSSVVLWLLALSLPLIGALVLGAVLLWIHADEGSPANRGDSPG